MFKDPALVIIIQLLRFLYCMYHHAKIWYLKNNSNTIKLSKRAKNYDLIYRKSLLFIKFVRDVLKFTSTTLLNFHVAYFSGCHTEQLKYYIAKIIFSALNLNVILILLNIHFIEKTCPERIALIRDWVMLESSYQF